MAATQIGRSHGRSAAGQRRDNFLFISLILSSSSDCFCIQCHARLKTLYLSPYRSSLAIASSYFEIEMQLNNRGHRSGQRNSARLFRLPRIE